MLLAASSPISHTAATLLFNTWDTQGTVPHLHSHSIIQPKFSTTEKNILFPTAYEVRRKALFILGNVCLSTWGGVPPSFAIGGGYPIHPDGGGVSSSFLMGVPHPSQWRYPIHTDWGGGSYPIQTDRGVPPSRPPGRDWMGCTPSWNWMGMPSQLEEDGGTPPLGLDGVPPTGPAWGTPSSPGTVRLGQVMPRYASCGFPQDFLVSSNMK